MSLYDHHLSLSLVLSLVLVSVSVDSSLSVKDICCFSKICLYRKFVSHKMHMGKQLAAMLAVKRSAGVVPEVDLGECTLHLPPQKQANKADLTLALISRGDITRNPKQGYHWCQNKTCVHQNFLKTRTHLIQMQTTHIRLSILENDPNLILTLMSDLDLDI